MDDHLDTLARSHDPYLRKIACDEIRQRMKTGGKGFSRTFSDRDLTKLVHKFGEQFVEAPCADLDRYFAIVHNRLTVPSRVPPGLLLLYLFGPKNSYRANLSALSACGEAVAGHWMEERGYVCWARPIGIMPDLVLADTSGVPTRIALVEAKASTVQTPNHLLEHCVHDFLVDIKTRANRFRFHYDGYLFCSQFNDGGKIDCICLHIDLGFYGSPASFTGQVHTKEGAAPDIDPAKRLRTLIQLQCDAEPAQDQYLAEVLAEETIHAAVLFQSYRDPTHVEVQKVTAFINDQVDELGRRHEWSSVERLIANTEQKRLAIIRSAVKKLTKHSVEWE
jgi:hypothetical protein